MAVWRQMLQTSIVVVMLSEGIKSRFVNTTSQCLATPTISLIAFRSSGAVGVSYVTLSGHYILVYMCVCMHIQVINT